PDEAPVEAGQRRWTPKPRGENERERDDSCSQRKSNLQRLRFDEEARRKDQCADEVQNLSSTKRPWWRLAARDRRKKEPADADDQRGNHPLQDKPTPDIVEPHRLCRGAVTGKNRPADPEQPRC